jgi:hypothetical protein
MIGASSLADFWNIAAGVVTFAAALGAAIAIGDRKRTLSLVTTLEATITAMRTELDLSDRKRAEQATTLSTQKVEIDNLGRQVSDLKDLVTQTAKVELLRQEVQEIRKESKQSFNTIISRLPQAV